MLTGWIRIFALIGIAALLANAQCYDKCVSTVNGSDRSSDHLPSKSCHHQKSSQEDSAPCPPQHQEIAGPQTGIAKISLEKINVESAMIPTLILNPGVAVGEPQILAQVDTGPSLASDNWSSISILRI